MIFFQVEVVARLQEGDFAAYPQVPLTRSLSNAGTASTVC
jgi:hypothetical protein